MRAGTTAPLRAHAWAEADGLPVGEPHRPGEYHRMMVVPVLAKKDALRMSSCPEARRRRPLVVTSSLHCAPTRREGPAAHGREPGRSAAGQ
ncbi:hypothetical protein [Streptomyces sp. NPDC057623]|uniref:hypothetical protein n=1 Tax=Streptomyces sp. NPDC057623 TaxID=3346187 RepID=UPI0036BBD24A